MCGIKPPGRGGRPHTTTTAMIMAHVDDNDIHAESNHVAVGAQEVRLEFVRGVEARVSGEG